MILIHGFMILRHLSNIIFADCIAAAEKLIVALEHFFVNQYFILS